VEAAFGHSPGTVDEGGIMRALDCDCGHHLEAEDDQQLQQRARQHIDDVHPDLDMNDDQVRELVGSKAYDA
jgi:predicted small metal-binding protein